MSIIDDIFATHARNQRFRHYDINVVIVPFEHVRMLVNKFHQRATPLPPIDI